MDRKVLVIGSGAREHALVHALRTSEARVWASPGNGGISEEAEIVDAGSWQEIRDRFADTRPLVVIGPEVPLAEGWSDGLREAGIPVVGPSQAAARLESSKRMAKEIMQRYHIPAARSRTAHSPQELAEWIRQESRWPKVFKQSRLAAGKGVVVVPNQQAAKTLLTRWAGLDAVWQDGVLYEDFLEGTELSVQVVTNGRDYRWLPVAQDYKRLTPDPESPNTGGMGAVAPALHLPVGMTETINRQVFDPIMQFLQDERLTYRGVLYAGLMMTADGPYVLEYNVRLGDPETEAIVPVLDLDWVEFWSQVAAGEVPSIPEPSRSAVAVVMAAHGYPDSPKTGMPIHLGSAQSNTLVFHAGTRRNEDDWESQGGRVLTVVGLGSTIDEARSHAYERIRHIDFPDSYYREDIGIRSTVQG